MQILDGKPVYSATDLVGYLVCGHLTDLERSALAGLVKKPIRDDPELDLIAERGKQHERVYIDRLQEEWPHRLGRVRGATQGSRGGATSIGNKRWSRVRPSSAVMTSSSRPASSTAHGWASRTSCCASMIRAAAGLVV